MKSIRKTMVVMLCIVLLMACLGMGCSQQAATPQTLGGSESVALEPSETLEEPVEITFQHAGGTSPAQLEVLDEVARAFEEENPGVKVNIMDVGWGEAHSTYMNSLAAGVAPDIVMMGGTWPVEFIEMGALAPVDEYVSEELLDSFFDSGFDAVRKEGDDHVYGIPWDGSTWALFYRTDLFEEAGLDPNSPPTTWEEVVEYGEKLSQNGTSGLVFPCAGWEPDDFFLPFLWQADNTIEKFEDGIWTSTLDDENGIAAAKFYYDLIHTYQIVPQEITGMDWEACKNAFVSGDAAMMFNGMWVVNSILQGNPELEGKWATAISPAGPNGTMATMGYPGTLNISQQSEHKEIAGRFLEFFCTGNDKDYFNRYMIATGVVGWTKDFLELDYANTTYIKPFVDSIEIGHNRPFAPKYEEFRKLYFCPGIQSLALGQVTPEEFAKDMAEKFNQLHAVG